MTSQKRKNSQKRRFRNFLILSLCIGSIFLIFHRKKEYTSSPTSFSSPTPDYTEESVFPESVYGVPVITDLTENEEIRPGTKRLIKYIVIHETDNTIKGVGAYNHSLYLKYNNESYTSWHYTVDDHEIYHHVPDNEVAYHAGEKDGNEHGIGIELCVNEDGDFEKTFDNAAKLVAYLLKSYDLEMDAVKTHYDFIHKDCPHNIRKANRMPEFKEKVASYLKEK